MLLDDEFRYLAGYLSVDHKGYRVAIGTVFFISLWEDIGTAEERYTSYCVTARHLLQRRFRKFYVSAREFPEVEVDHDQWVQHSSTDLAICRMEQLEAGRTVKFPIRQRIDKISAGHNVFMIGLLDPLETHTREVELVARFGHVALPEVTVSICLDLEKPSELTSVHARLIETRSWGGESGSPVFIHSEYYYDASGLSSFTGMLRPSGFRKSEVRASQTDYTLLGILHGHFNAESPSEPNRVMPDEHIIDVNAGIAVVIPTEDILKLLMSDERLLRDREQRPKRKVNAPVPDSKAVDDEQQRFTKADFEAALKKVARKIEPDTSA
jgi:hypothetical protein